MRVLNRWLRHLLDAPVRMAVQEAIAAASLSAEDSLYTPMVHGDRARLHIDSTAVVNNALFNLSSGHVWVGPYAFFGHSVAVLTGTHDITKFGRERQLAIPRDGRDVRIGEGAWLASHVLVLGPCTIGEHSVVAGGSLVMSDVEPYTVVAGRPAQMLRTILPEEADETIRRGGGSES
ncbi:MAG: acyltransferase [Nitriliruptorales bacterium]|nr:acyltransferase [Nitriliruptorales bacterium]